MHTLFIIIIFIIVLALLILVHEFGHFIVAKKTGMRVDEFGFGFPPKIWGKKFGETEYSINAIPFGGFVRIFGEDATSSEHEDVSEHDRERSFVKKPHTLQGLVVIAGVFFNMLFAWILISFGLMMGLPLPLEYAPEGARVENVSLAVGDVLPDSPAERAGLKAGDMITSVSSEGDTLTQEHIDMFSSFLAQHGEKEVLITYERPGEEVSSINVVPEKGVIKNNPDIPAVGISTVLAGNVSLPVLSAFWEGAKFTWLFTKIVAVGLADFFLHIFEGDADFSQVTGPVGIVGVVGDATGLGFVYLLMLVAIISIHLAIINLVPFPALDGGRLLFVIIEAIKGSPMNPKVVNWVNAAGFVLLLILMIVVTFNDIARLIG